MTRGAFFSGVEHRPSGANQTGGALHNQRLVLTLLRRRALGLKVGRRSVELASVDLAGGIVARRGRDWPVPTPDALVRFLDQAVPEILSATPGAPPPCGTGIAMPYEIWAWDDYARHAPRAEWEALDLVRRIEAQTGAPAHLRNDMTCAARGELAWGTRRAAGDWIYLYIGALPGGGVVLDGRVRDGRLGNAGALGPLPVRGGAGGQVQLLDIASLLRFEQMAGRDLAGYDWALDDPVFETWLGQTVKALAQAVTAACAVLDFELLVIDGLFPDHVRELLVDRVRAAMAEQDLRGLIVPEVAAGSVGADARVLGAATVALEAEFFLS
ncbi:ROK family protein [Roseobacter sp. HKCCA0434]|uniref:ROK family protein n=1 Tax=Roseobacter sp. HKCCA0434 TaxID=3079297 RepID=UPI002905972E|nr:ROK family protein [Roseobacter sp. HKCCA0434]